MPTNRWSSAVLAAALLLIAGCTPNQESAAPSSSVLSQPPSHPAGPAPPAGTARPLEASFAELAATIGGTVGLAFAPIGTNTVTALGAWSEGVAWSTIKVPLAIAALRVHHAQAQPFAVRAITESDNAAAEQLWAQLGSPDQAAPQVQAVLRETGDAATVVESRRLRPSFTAFGQTQWPLDRQAQFAAHLPCLPDTGGVLDLMHNLVAGQRWGLAADGAATKGGWGPGLADGYLVRQFGIVSTGAGEVGVALAADTATFEAGVAALNQLAQWVTQHKSELPSGRCPG